MTQTYNKIRFIGYAIPTTPAKLISIGDPNGPGAVAGTYLANNDVLTDLRKRVEIMKHAVDTAKNKIKDSDESVINVFVAPEFYFHGTEGPYVYDEDSKDPILELQQILSDTFNRKDYPNWTFIFGSAITTKIRNMNVVYDSNSAKMRNNIVRNLSENWQASFGPLKGVIFDMLVNFIKNCHSYPNCEVRNRSVIVSNIDIRTPEIDNQTNLMTTEKYYVSNEDFLLYDVTGKQVVTEQMVAYPSIDLSSGDAKNDFFDPYAIFRQNNIDPSNPLKTTVTDYGVEICLDHSDVRLRRNIENEPSVIGGIHIQIIPSCGMQISLPSVAADDNGFVFNCDGQYTLNSKKQGQESINGVDCLFANYTYSKDTNYKAHTQLARVEKSAEGGDANASSSTNATLLSLSEDNIHVINIPSNSSIDSNLYFSGGIGEIHIYGLSSPFVLYP